LRRCRRRCRLRPGVSRQGPDSNLGLQTALPQWMRTGTACCRAGSANHLFALCQVAFFSWWRGQSFDRHQLSLRELSANHLACYPQGMFALSAAVGRCGGDRGVRVGTRRLSGLVACASRSQSVPAPRCRLDPRRTWMGPPEGWPAGRFKEGVQFHLCSRPGPLRQPATITGPKRPAEHAYIRAERHWCLDRAGAPARAGGAHCN
jgi:hypothetical protein